MKISLKHSVKNFVSKCILIDPPANIHAIFCQGCYMFLHLLRDRTEKSWTQPRTDSKINFWSSWLDFGINELGQGIFSTHFVLLGQ